eukprot:gb/GECG01012697.1/.p1 GENE.gb/GECG01012697.1/~~gb/GECG01012697.1/.p1  ORF type:complete len:959 (+),score=164.97 gb/GECG01012697.1/:1-2877(+)
MDRRRSDREALTELSLPDPHHVAHQQNIDSLQEVLPDLVYTPLKEHEVEVLPDKLLAKLLSMSQIYVRKQIEQQDAMQARIREKKRRLQELQMATQKKQRRIVKKHEQHEKKLARAERTVKGYRALVSYLQLEMRKEARKRRRQQELEKQRALKDKATTIEPQQALTAAEPEQKHDDNNETIRMLQRHQEKIYSQLQEIAEAMKSYSSRQPSQPHTGVSDSQLEELKRHMKEDRELFYSRTDHFMKDVRDNINSVTSLQEHHRQAVEDVLEKLRAMNSRIANVEADTRNATELANRALDYSMKASQAGRLQSDEPMVETGIQTDQPAGGEEDMQWKYQLQAQIDELRKLLEQQRVPQGPARPVEVSLPPQVTPEESVRQFPEPTTDQHEKATTFYENTKLQKVFGAWKSIPRTKPKRSTTKSKQEVFKFGTQWKRLPHDSSLCYKGSGYWTILDLNSKDACETELSGRTKLLSYAKKLHQRCRKSYNILQRNGKKEWMDKLPAETEVKEGKQGTIEVRIPPEWNLVVPLARTTLNHQKSSRGLISISPDTMIERAESLLAEDLCPDLTANIFLLGMDPVVARKLSTQIINHQTCTFYSDVSTEEADFFWHRPLARLCEPLSDDDVEHLINSVGSRAKGTYSDNPDLKVLGSTIGSANIQGQVSKLVHVIEELGIHTEFQGRLNKLEQLGSRLGSTIAESPYLHPLWQHSSDTLSSKVNEMSGKAESELSRVLRQSGVSKKDAYGAVKGESTFPTLSRRDLKQALSQTSLSHEGKEWEKTVTSIAETLRQSTTIPQAEEYDAFFRKINLCRSQLNTGTHGIGRSESDEGASDSGSESAYEEVQVGAEDSQHEEETGVEELEGSTNMEKGENGDHGSGHVAHSRTERLENSSGGSPYNIEAASIEQDIHRRHLSEEESSTSADAPRQDRAATEQSAATGEEGTPDIGSDFDEESIEEESM